MGGIGAEKGVEIDRENEARNGPKKRCRRLKTYEFTEPSAEAVFQKS
jgi:hypothetical protein